MTPRLIALLVAVTTTATACSLSLRDQPTPDLLARVGKEKKVVRLNLAAAPEVLLAKLAEQGRQCVVPQSTEYADVATGTVAVGVRRTIEAGTLNDGTPFVALRIDTSMAHGISMAVEAKPSDTGSQVRIYPADKRKPELIQKLLEDGSLFCRWEAVSYPYD